MKLFKKIKMAVVADVMLALLIVCGIVVYAALPWLMELYFQTSTIYLLGKTYIAIMVLMYASGIPAITLLVLALRLMVNITRGEAFVRKNAHLLGQMGICALVISGLFLIGSFFINSIFIAVVCVVFLLLAVLAKVFRELFSKAIDYKEENELTI